MKNLILALVLLLAFEGYAQQRIIGGNEISITERPFQVHIEKKDIENVTNVLYETILRLDKEIR